MQYDHCAFISMCWYLCMVCACVHIRICAKHVFTHILAVSLLLSHAFSVSLHLGLILTWMLFRSSILQACAKPTNINRNAWVCVCVCRCVTVFSSPQYYTAAYTYPIYTCDTPVIDSVAVRGHFYTRICNVAFTFVMYFANQRSHIDNIYSNYSCSYNSHGTHCGNVVVINITSLCWCCTILSWAFIGNVHQIHNGICMCFANVYVYKFSDLATAVILDFFYSIHEFTIALKYE